MKTEVKKNIFVWLICGFGFISIARGQDVKFGKISAEDFKTNKCPIDSNAHAYYISDIGESEFTYLDTKIYSDDPSFVRKGFQIEFERTYRLKVVDNSGLDFANIEIPLYSNGNDKEKLLDFKAITYNYENGKVIKDKFEGQNILKERKNANIEIQKIALPNVKAGSIIDVKYVIRTDFIYNLHGWKFQKNIPVMKTSYEVKIPQYIEYNEYLEGLYPIKKQEDQNFRKIEITYIQKAEGAAVSERIYKHQFEYKETIKRYLGDSIPAFKTDCFLTTYDNYITKLEFELSKTKFEGEPIVAYSTSWSSVIKKLSEYEFFGQQLTNSGFIKKDAENLKIQTKGIDLIYRSFDFIKSRFKWNSLYSSIASIKLSDSYKNWTGNSADINLTLVLLLRELGFEAYPVVISTRDNGRISINRPTISGFNHVIVMAKFNGMPLLMDATSTYSEINLLPENCLNGSGLIIDNVNGGLISLDMNKMFKRQNRYDLELNSIGNFNGILNSNSVEYAKYNELKYFANKDNLAKQYEKDKPGLKVDSIIVNRVDSTNKLVKQLKVSVVNKSSVMNDLISFKPLLFNEITENPFKYKERHYPVEMPYPYFDVVSYKIKIPLGYKVEALPKSTTIALPENAGRFSFSISEVDGVLVVNSLLSINKTVFPADEFKGIYDFYNLIVDKTNEEILLKKL